MRSRPLIYRPKIAEIFDRLSPTERQDLRWMLDYGVTRESAKQLLLEGIREEAREGSRSVDGIPIPFTPSSLADLECFGNGEVRSQLEKELQDVHTNQDTKNRISLVCGRGWLVSAGPFRIILGTANITGRTFVASLAAAGINPLAKIWRYFDQKKAKYLIKTSSLYCARLDQFPDPNEGKLPYLAKQRQIQMVCSVFGSRAEKADEDGEAILRGNTYASCWTLREFESHLAWKNYCPANGGFAIQSTWRRVAHLHRLLRQDDEKLYCRAVGYLDPRTDDLPNNAEGEQVFWKAQWFSDENEIRFVLMDTPSGTHAELLKQLAAIPPNRRGRTVKCDLKLLVDQIVMNPFSSRDKQMRLRELIHQHHPDLVARIKESDLITV